MKMEHKKLILIKIREENEVKVSVIIPCYNEQDNIELIHEKLSEVFKNNKENYELIFVDDGSKDETLKKIKHIHEKDDAVKCISFSRNFGKEAAMYAGLKETTGEYVAIIDADLQQRPEILLEMMDILDKNEEYDAVAAFQKERTEGKALSLCKRAFYSIINSIAETEFKQGASDFRMIRRKVADAIIDIKEYYRFSKGIFSWVGFNTYYMEYSAEKRANGNTKWSFKKLAQYAKEGIVAFTTMPLKLPIWFGMIAMPAILVMLIITIINYSQLNLIITLIIFLFGLQFIFIGIIGEYLAHTYIENKNRPIYIVKEKIK